MSQPAVSDFNRKVTLAAEQLVSWGFGCDSCLVKLLVGGHCEERVRESQREQRRVFNFHLQLEVIIPLEFDPAALSNWPLAFTKLQILSSSDTWTYNEESIRQERQPRWEYRQPAGM